ncbi:MAG: gamma-glutamyl-gamma-aminobutyrate hydrolase family protein [Anaerolineae bacterium]|nr:gamma-glutamyl-gamma-aminobutyrate hydrolase family protein [Anaerolineae bacterium]
MAILEFFVVDCGSQSVKHLYDFLENQEIEYTVIPLAEANAISFKTVDGVIISGGPHLFTEQQKEFARQFAFIDRLQVPTLGICLGHQAIGVRYGVTVYRDVERRTLERIALMATHPLTKGLPKNVYFSASHCEGIPLPLGFKLLGLSQYYPVEIMACQSKPLFGVQFHPEISGPPGLRLLRNFVEIATLEKIIRAKNKC